MAWYNILHACGHTERHQLYGPGKTREWRAARLAEEPCAACWRAEREAENARAAEANKAAELPALTGTEKQISWAESIRAGKLGYVSKALAGELKGLEIDTFFGDCDPQDPDLPAVLDALQAQTSASWWIDRRDLKVSAMLFELAPAVEKARAAAPDSPSAETAHAEALVRPATNERIPTATEIRIFADRIEAALPERNDAHRDLVKALGYAWSGSAWVRKIDGCSGPVADRAAELGNRLLAAGFPVRIQDAEIRAAAIAGSFAPERRRWIKLRTAGEHAGKLFVVWQREEDFYNAARALPGARYDKPGILVPADRWDALLDFADAHGFAVTEAAQTALDAARKAQEAATLATPARAPRTAPSPGTMPPSIGDIDPDLRDDDSSSESAMLHGDSGPSWPEF